MPPVTEDVNCLSCSDWTTFCELGSGLGGKGGGDKLRKVRDLREGRGGGVSPPPPPPEASALDMFVADGENCKTQQKPIL